MNSLYLRLSFWKKVVISTLLLTAITSVDPFASRDLALLSLPICFPIPKSRSVAEYSIKTLYSETFLMLRRLRTSQLFYSIFFKLTPDASVSRIKGDASLSGLGLF